MKTKTKRTKKAVDWAAKMDDAIYNEFSVKAETSFNIIAMTHVTNFEFPDDWNFDQKQRVHDFARGFAASMMEATA